MNAVDKRQKPHCEDGHLNTFVKDQDSYVTGFGKHERVVCFFSTYGDEPYARVDFCHALRSPSDAEIVEVLKKDAEDMGGNWTPSKWGKGWKVKRRIPWGTVYEREDVYFEKVK